MDGITQLVSAILGHEHVRYLVYLVIANLLLGIVASLKSGDFRLTRVADWLGGRVFPLLAGYGSAALIAVARPELGLLRDAAFLTLTATLLGYVLGNLKDFGVQLPEQLAGKDTDEDVPTSNPHVYQYPDPGTPTPTRRKARTDNPA